MTDCTFSENTAPSGGAISNEDCSPILTNCAFTHNSAGHVGGAISNTRNRDEPVLTLIKCTFTENVAENSSGAVFNWISSAVLINCTFSGNRSHEGGAMHTYTGSATLTNCSFSGNSANVGGAMYNYIRSKLVMDNCTFTGNAAENGGGIYNKSSTSTLINCTFAGNSGYTGDAIACDSAYFQECSNLELTNCILWDDGKAISNNDNSTIVITYSDVRGEQQGEGNIDVDPLFADPGYWDPNGTPDDQNDDFWVDGDYHIKSEAGRWDPVSESWVIDDVTSPCIDAGDPNSLVAFELFPNGGIINMGAYGGTTEASKSPSSLHAKYGGGTGEPNNPYLIYTAEQMNAIGAEPNDWDKHFKLMADIDLSSYTGTAFNIIGERYYYDVRLVKNPFTGVFDGNGKRVSNFSYTSTDIERVGLFGYVEGGTIKDLGLIDPNVDAGTGDYVGSLVGDMDEGTITNCYATGGVSGEGKVGGLVGKSEDSTITNCYATGGVSGVGEVGGLVGESKDSTITNCYATGGVWGNDYVGGLVGNKDGTITNCYATGSVSGDNYVGGLVGARDYWHGSINSSFWDMETSGQATSAGGTGLTTHEMQDINTYLSEGWDFVDKPDGPSDIWAEPAGGGYPILWWQLSPLPELPTFSGGTGEPNDPYLVSTAADLNSIDHNPRLMEAHFKLMSDIDLTGVDFFIIGNRILPFTGVFDGNGHTISNFSYISTDTYSRVGLFRYVSWGGEIKDLGLIAPDVDAGTGRGVGSLVGRLQGGTIINCYAEGGSVLGDWSVGGLVGKNDDGTITNCYVQGSRVSGWSTIGGLVGGNGEDDYSGTITNCYVQGGRVSGDGRIVGGLVGTNYNGTGTITNCYATGSVTGTSDFGGLVGGGNGTVIFSFWDTQASGKQDSNGGTPKTTAEMQTATTFLEAGWDFVDETKNGTDDIWWIPEGHDYPRLWWETSEQ
jgi:predicted outer membrane repeat protein